MSSEVPGPAPLLDAIEELDLVGDQILFGIRHHSPACARAVVAAAEELCPRQVAVELPADLAHLVPWLWHSDTRAPVAIAAATTAEEGATATGLYPFADFSPELAIIRWAGRNGIPVHCIDLPVGSYHRFPATEDVPGAGHARVGALPEFLSQESWDRQVEARSIGATWRQVRRAGLAVGLAARRAGYGIDALTRAREEYMSGALAGIKGRTLVVVGAFHCGGLQVVSGVGNSVPVEAVVTSLVRYSFDQLDSRSGYASGIRDPRWQQGMLLARTPEDVERLVTEVLTALARACRSGGEPAGTGEVVEARRFAVDLARLRGLPAPGRREVVEAVTSVFAQGSVLGRGRMIALAMQQVLVGDVVGELPDDAPVPALEAHVRQEMARLGLPAAEGEESGSVRVEPFKRGRNLERHLLLARLAAVGVAYEIGRTGGSTRGLENRSYTVTIRFESRTAAGLGLLAPRGVTLAQAVATELSARLARQARDPDPEVVLELISLAAATLSAGVLSDALGLFESGVLTRLSFEAAVSATEILTGIAGGREPAAQLFDAAVLVDCDRLAGELGAVIVREIEGVAGSEDPAHARLLGQVVGLQERHPLGLVQALRRVRTSGSPLMQGAAYAVSTAGGAVDIEAAGAFLGSWIDQHAGSDSRRRLQRRLVGYLCASRGAWCDDPALDGVIERVEALSDASFVDALPPLRGAFDQVPAAERERFLDRLAGRLGHIDALLTVPPETLAANARSDQAAHDRLVALGLADISFTPATRWRLILGAEPERLGTVGRRMARTLDELYGDARNDPTGEADGRVRGTEGSHNKLGVRKWSQEITALFGEDHLQEIFGEAAERGRADVVTALTPESIHPNIETLTTVLSLVGGLPEARLRQLRPLVARIVRELSEQLSSQLRPVLTGATARRPTLRRTGRMNLPGTIRRNLRHVVEHDGRRQIVPVHPVYDAARRRESPWHIIVLVDVSGSMEASTVYAALTAAILAGVPTFRVSFITFNSGVVDLSEHATDPLELLLEIRIGGGTNIAGAVAYAATLVTVPARTALMVISDFEEGGSVGELLAGIRRLADSGVHLIGCAALDDTGQAAFNVGISRAVAEAGMRVASLSPMQLARWVGEVLT